MSDREQSAGAIPRLILASGSSARHAILKNASIAFTVIPADIDEDAVRNSLLATDQQIDPADLAEMLAQAKGSVVSTNNVGSLVIAADQILVCGDEVFTKPADQNAARETLMKLRGKTHQLHSAVVLARDGEIIWSHVETANLAMRKFTATFIAEYMLRSGADICESVGAYKLEGMGTQLFDRIEGDYFTILGLPLMPLLAKLREMGALTT